MMSRNRAKQTAMIAVLFAALLALPLTAHA